MAAFAAIICLISPPSIAGKSEARKNGVNSAIRILKEDNSGCSGVRIDENLILSAAHCVVGIDGSKKSKPYAAFHIKDGEAIHALNILEVGDFEPPKGKMSDYAVFEAPAGALSNVSPRIAMFPPREELDSALKNVVSAGGHARGTEVFSATFPSSFFRLSPRQGYNRTNIPFVSVGRLRTYEAYKSYLAFVARTNQYYDEEYGRQKMVFDKVDPEEWQKLSKTEILAKVVEVDQKYIEDGNPLLYHTADYSQGSSGGGIFLEGSGNLLGIVPYSRAVCYPQSSYCGTGVIYRIDNICRQSAVLSNLEKCRQMMGQMDQAQTLEK